jgi:UDP:flavonoid glycosyltransferase YjiC (YdhE family)
MHRAVNRILFRDMACWLDDALAAVGAPSCPVALMDWPRLADRLLQLSVPGFEYPRGDLPPSVAFVGPVLPRAVRDFDPPPWWGEMRRARTVVHVTQGTLDNGNLDQLIGPTVEAFADDDGVVVVATVGRRAGQQITFAIPSNAHVCEWIPYSALLPHVDVMVTNGGYGGVNHALSYGIPVVVAGESSDKAEVAARVAHTGVGINLRTAHPRARQIAAAVRSIDDTHRQAAGRLGQQIAQTTPLDAIADVVAAELAAAAQP